MIVQRAVSLLFGMLINVSTAQAGVDDAEFDVNVDAPDRAGNTASSDAGVVGAGVEMTGVAVINGAVWIDGVRISKPQSVYTSKKTGKTYHIRWGKDGNVSVAEE